MDKLKVGIVGCGTIFHYHYAFIEAHPGATVCAVADRDEKALRMVSDRYGIKNCYSDLEEMIRKEATDVVHITTPPQTHAAWRSAMNLGNHVHVETDDNGPCKRRETLQCRRSKGVSFAWTTTIFRPWS